MSRESKQTSDDKSITKEELLKNKQNKHIHRDATQSDRRSLLRGTFGMLGTTIASSFGLSTGTSAAKSPNRELAKAAAEEYNSPEAVRRTVRKYATGLLQRLVECGHLEHSSVTELDVESLYTSSMSEYFAAGEAAAVFGYVDGGEPRTRIQIKQRTPAGQKLLLVIKPQLGDSYAVLPDVSTDGAISVRSRDVTTSGDTGGEDTPCGCYCQDVTRHCAVTCVGGECNCLQYHICGDGNCDCCWTETGCVESCQDSYSC